MIGLPPNPEVNMKVEPFEIFNLFSFDHSGSVVCVSELMNSMIFPVLEYR